MNIYLALKKIEFCFTARHWKGHGVQAPFAFSFIREVFLETEPFYFFAPLRFLRKHLLQSRQMLSNSSFGAGSKVASSDKRTVASLVRWSSVTVSKGEFLARIAHFVKAQTMLELGTCMGLATLYLAMANKRAVVYTIEGGEQYLDQAKAHFDMMQATNIKGFCGSFEDVLPRVLEITDTLDLVYLDGNHQEEPTVAYFNEVLTNCHQKSVIIMDDIYWSKGMNSAWKRIVANEKVTLSFDFFDLGVLFLNPKLQKEHFKVRRTFLG